MQITSLSKQNIFQNRIYSLYKQHTTFATPHRKFIETENNLNFFQKRVDIYKKICYYNTRSEQHMGV